MHIVLIDTELVKIFAGWDIIRSQHCCCSWASKEAGKQRKTHCGMWHVSNPFTLLYNVDMKAISKYWPVNHWYRLFFQALGSDTCRLRCLMTWERRLKPWNQWQWINLANQTGHWNLDIWCTINSPADMLQLPVVLPFPSSNFYHRSVISFVNLV